MKNATRIPSPIAATLLLAAGFALSACERTDVPAGETSPAAREAASQADAIAVPPVPQASEPGAASQPQAPASPVSSADEPMRPSVAETAGAGALARQTPSTATATMLMVADKPAGTAASAPAAASGPAGGSASAAGGAGGAKLYQVVDGYKVDEATMEGFRTWRAAACDRCHGANQEGMVGPSLIESLKVRDKAFFDEIITNGRLAKGMPSFKTSKMVMENLDELYAYLKGRSDGAITRSKVEPMK